MQGSDDFRKDSNNQSNQDKNAALTLFGSSIALFRSKALLNLILHLVFASLYAFEHNNQVVLYTEAIANNSSPAGNVRVNEESVVDVVYTPAGNIVIMAINLILAPLTL